MRSLPSSYQTLVYSCRYFDSLKLQDPKIVELQLFSGSPFHPKHQTAGLHCPLFITGWSPSLSITFFSYPWYNLNKLTPKTDYLKIRRVKLPRKYVLYTLHYLHVVVPSISNKCRNVVLSCNSFVPYLFRFSFCCIWSMSTALVTNCRKMVSKIIRWWKFLHLIL